MARLAVDGTPITDLRALTARLATGGRDRAEVRAALRAYESLLADAHAITAFVTAPTSSTRAAVAIVAVLAPDGNHLDARTAAPSLAQLLDELPHLLDTANEPTEDA